MYYLIVEQILHVAYSMVEPRHRGARAWVADLGRSDHADEG
jgi:hypothetical protein